MTSVISEAWCKINLIGVVSINYFPSVHSENLILTRRHNFLHFWYVEVNSSLVKTYVCVCVCVCVCLYIHIYKLKYKFNINLKCHLPLLLLLYVCVNIYRERERKNKMKVPFPRPSQLLEYGYYMPTALLKCRPFENMIDKGVNYFQ